VHGTLGDWNLCESLTNSGTCVDLLFKLICTCVCTLSFIAVHCCCYALCYAAAADNSRKYRCDCGWWNRIRQNDTVDTGHSSLLFYFDSVLLVS